MKPDNIDQQRSHFMDWLKRCYPSLYTRYQLHFNFPRGTQMVQVSFDRIAAADLQHVEAAVMKYYRDLNR